MMPVQITLRRSTEGNGNYSSQTDQVTTCCMLMSRVDMQDIFCQVQKVYKFYKHNAGHMPFIQYLIILSISAAAC